MAHEVFALSPISARAALPSEEDYAAISEAFMETARGRWFLTEYAKRNRNADTLMVLDAVARIEQSLAAQKEERLFAQREERLAAQQERLAAQKEESLAAQKEESLAAQQQAATAAAENRLTEALAAIRSAVEAAQASAIEAIDGLALGQQLTPVRKGARVLREIAWRLREIGNDGRICDLIDSQVGVIETGVEQISSDQARAALSAAFAAIEGRLADLGHRDGAAAPAAEAITASPSPAPQEMPPAAEAALAEAALAEAEAALAQTEPAEVTEVTSEVADAHDEAVLDMIAMEMGAPDPIDDDEIVDDEIIRAMAEEAQFAEPEPAEPEPAEPEIVTQMPEPAAAPIEPPVQPAPRPTVEPVPAIEMSLGSTIIASGLLRKPAVAANDPLAPIRRMSQAEKIAFFS